MNYEYDGRLKAMGIATVVIIVGLILRMGYLQVYNGDYYSRLADGNRIRLIPSTAPRGIFYDRRGEMLVTNRPGFTVSLLPLTSPISDDVIRRLAALLNIPEEKIKERIDGAVGVDPIRIKNDVTPEILSIIEEQKDDYPGVIIEVQPIRNYTYKSMAAHALGYVSEISDEELEKKKKDGYRVGDIIGQYGLERYYDRELRGENGGQQVEVDVSGKPVQILGSRDTIPGCDLVLTIDKDLQLATERAVDEQLAAIGAGAAAAVVMNPQTGEILAMASRPAFDPNWFINGISEANWRRIMDNPYFVMDNKAITGEYPPGSTFKIVTGTAALTEGVVTPEELVLDTGTYWIDEKTNAGGEVLGWINFQQAMAHSDNVYFYEMGYRLGIDRLEKFSRMFGLGEKTGIDLPYESEGLVASPKYKREAFDDEWYISETLDAAIGQGFNLVTPLQACMIMSEIAASGKRYQPYLVQRVVAPGGATVKEFTPKLVSELAVPPETISLIQNSLREVTNYGTASFLFSDFPVPIAGKTGTSENPHGRDHGWFVAYGPFDYPQVAVAVIVEQGGFGSQSAVPIGLRILEEALIAKRPEPPQQTGADGKAVPATQKDKALNNMAPGMSQITGAVTERQNREWAGESEEKSAPQSVKTDRNATPPTAPKAAPAPAQKPPQQPAPPPKQPVAAPPPAPVERPAAQPKGK